MKRLREVLENIRKGFENNIPFLATSLWINYLRTFQGVLFKEKRGIDLIKDYWEKELIHNNEKIEKLKIPNTVRDKLEEKTKKLQFRHWSELKLTLPEEILGIINNEVEKEFRELINYEDWRSQDWNEVRKITTFFTESTIVKQELKTTELPDEYLKGVQRILEGSPLFYPKVDRNTRIYIYLCPSYSDIPSPISKKIKESKGTYFHQNSFRSDLHSLVAFYKILEEGP